MPGGAGMNTLNSNNGGTKLKLTFNRDGGGGANGMANGAAIGAGSGGGSGSGGGMSDDDEE